MKKLIIWTVTILVMPLIIVSLLNNEVATNFKSKKNIIVKVKRMATNKIEKINFEDYIVGVLAGEMPVSFSLEALKAQAVAARSYAMVRINADNEYDVVDTTLNQVYLDDNYLREKWQDKYVEYINKLRQAVYETSGEYLVYNEKIADALFFSTSNGYTENVNQVFKYELPYLSSVESKWDLEENPNYKATKSLSLTEFFEKLSIKNSEKLVITDVVRNDTNRIISININGQNFTGREVYTALSLRSTDFDIKQDNTEVLITTYGHGHGVGMSQYGALGMAKKGYSYQEILNHYYKDTKIKKIV